MKYDTLSQLGLVPEQTPDVTGRLRRRLVDFLLRWEQYESALACVDELLALNPKLVTFLDAKVKGLLGLEQPDLALEVIKARHKLRTSVSSRALEARVHLALGETGTALAIASDLVSEHPQTVTAWGILGQVRLAQQDFGNALTAYQRIAELSPNSRTYLMGMLALHKAQDDYVTASGYAVRLQRSATQDRPLSPYMLRELRDYYRISGELNRAEDIESALSARYETDLTELKEALADDLRVLTGRPVRLSTAETEPEAPERAVEPPLQSDDIPVSEQERRHLEQAVRRIFGYERFLPGQVEAMAAMLRGRDVLAIMPTGGGKSLCYQLPALLDREGTTLVISPLIALMKDQVDSLPPAARRQATTINSTLDGDELRRRMRAVTAGRYRMVYAAPERLRQPPFLHALRRAGISRLVIDEAHCVSVWGHDFRPDYLHIARARQLLGNPPLLALTATAPPRVRRDIVERLANSGQRMAVVVADVHRPNLYLAAIRAGNADEKLRHLLALCQAQTGSGIVYAGTRARCERIAALLAQRGIAAGYYHAGIGDRRARSAAQDTFMQGDVRVMVATVAFGMGIDKADIRFIIHFQLPPSLESYYQEAGRAGRDGLPAQCVLIYSPHDRGVLTRRARKDALKVEFLRRVYAAVQRRLGESGTGRIATDDLRRDLRADETHVRVALSTLEEARLLRRHQDLPRTAVVRLRDGAMPDRPETLDAFLDAARLRPGQPLPLDLLAVAGTAGLDAAGIETQLLEWSDAGWLDFRPAGRDLLLELLPPPEDAATRVEALIDRHATIQVQRVDEIAAYAATRRCRHGHISAYLSGHTLEACEACDNCRPPSDGNELAASPDLPEEWQQLRSILRCVANAPGDGGWGRANLTYILLGSARASERVRTSPQWAELAFRSRAAIESMVDRLIKAGLLKPKELRHGGVTLELTPAGRAALQDPGRLASLEATKAAPTPKPAPDTSSDDEPEPPPDDDLFERLRSWRLETSQEAGVPPYVVAHDAVLRRIAAYKPGDRAALLDIKGIGPRTWEKYGAALLKLVGNPDAG